MPKLLNALADVEGLEWIRLHYAYPSKFPLEVLDVMRERANICKYIDIPLQHASNNMLAAMKRNITREEMGELIQEIRKRVPGIAIRTTLIAGFPGETLEDIEELKALKTVIGILMRIFLQNTLKYGDSKILLRLKKIQFSKQ